MRRAAFLLFLLMIVLITVLAGCGQDAPAEKTEATEQTAAKEQTTAAQDNRRYTLEKYLQIKAGDTYEAVCGLLGTPGEAVVDNARLKQYKWTNEDKTSLSVTFYDNKVTAKTQDHLGPFLSGANMVTLAKYEKLKEGQSLKEVTAILGLGTEMMLVTGEGPEKRTYIWQNKDGGTISVTLEGDKVTKISKMILK